MQTNSIYTINTALFVMRHFVELSAKLLPYFERITREQTTNDKVILEKEKIQAVYENYDINPTTSKLLMDSNIISLIQKGYKAIKNREKAKDPKVYKLLKEFKHEYKKLQKDWNSTLMN